MLTWAKSSPMSIRAREADYHVSRSVVLDTATGELGDVYLAWFGRAVIGRFAGEEGAKYSRMRCSEHRSGIMGASTVGGESPAVGGLPQTNLKERLGV